MNLAAFREIAKALAALFSTLAASLAAASATDQGLNTGGTVVALVGALGAGLLTFAVPNARPAGSRRAGETTDDDETP
jgi:hypothetical protein